jgi:hypothetical protein
MKDIVIPAKSIRREIRLALICIVLALLVNAGAIFFFKTQWKEMLTTPHYTLAVAMILYALSALPRICWIAMKRLFRGSKPGDASKSLP